MRSLPLLRVLDKSSLKVNRTHQLLVSFWYAKNMLASGEFKEFLNGRKSTTVNNGTTFPFKFTTAQLQILQAQQLLELVALKWHTLKSSIDLQWKVKMRRISQKWLDNLVLVILLLSTPWTFYLQQISH